MAHRVGFRRVLVVVKHTPFEAYQQLKAQGKAPLALRWGRLKNRHMIHRECVSAVLQALDKESVRYTMVGREEMDRQHLENVDLVVSVGGDGTALSASHFLDDSIPLLGINSDPGGAVDLNTKTDERRSYGALCMCNTATLSECLPKVLYHEVEPSRRTRIQTVVKSTFTETKLPPALNDVLISHPSPAAVSRFRIGFLEGSGLDAMEHFSFNVWSSGLWVCTATGSTAAMTSSGGLVMPLDSRELQYMVREHLVEAHTPHLRAEGHGMVSEGNRVRIRWNSQYGRVYTDGEHASHKLELGDEVDITAFSPPLMLYASDKQVEMAAQLDEVPAP